MQLFKFAKLPMEKLLEITKNFLGLAYPFYPAINPIPSGDFGKWNVTWYL